MPVASPTPTRLAGAKALRSPVALVAEVFDGVCTGEDTLTENGAAKGFTLQRRHTGQSPPPLAEMGLTPDEFWEEVRCGLAAPDAAPPSFCKGLQRHFCERAIDAPELCGQHFESTADHDPLVFDQYSLEETMLGKWLASSHRCVDCSPDDIELVVVPSYLFHCFARHGGPLWEV